MQDPLEGGRERGVSRHRDEMKTTLSNEFCCFPRYLGKYLSTK